MTGTVNLATTCVPLAQMVQLLLVPVVESPENSCRMNRNSNGNREVRQHKCGILGAVGHCEEFDAVLVHRANMEEKDFKDKIGFYDVVPRSDAAKKGCRVIRTRWVFVVFYLYFEFISRLDALHSVLNSLYLHTLPMSKLHQ